MIGGRPGSGYSCTIANDGELTSRGSAPSSVAMARARNVLPLPRSPVRCTTASGGRARAISRPAASVSDSLRQRYVFTTRGCSLLAASGVKWRIMRHALLLFVALPLFAAPPVPLSKLIEEVHGSEYFGDSDEVVTRAAKASADPKIVVRTVARELKIDEIAARDFVEGKLR